MALNAETIHALTEELNLTLRDGKIEKVQQPEKDLLLLTVRASGENHRVLIRAAGPNARVHLTEQSFENPKDAPMFCMLLRKYLTGARIREITQPGGDRLMVFSLEARNELGDSTSLKLITELMGRAANVLLLDADERILDCLRRVPPSEHGGRGLLPGLRYELPPQRPEGLQPPQNELDDSAQTDIAANGSLSMRLDRRYAVMERQEIQRRHARELLKSVRRARDRQQRKLGLQLEELRRCENLESVRRRAELLQANLYRVKKGEHLLQCENYFDPDCPTVDIALDPLKNPQQNLAAAFKEYRKLKGAREHLTVLTAEGEKQLDYLNSVLDELARAENVRDLEDIRAELTKTGVLNSRKGSSGKEKNKPGKKQKRSVSRMSEPLRFVTPDGLEVLVGRNNLQNDELTTELARRTDYWFHVKDLHGSHVILRCEGQLPSDTALEYAAELAAKYSQAAESGKVAVDYAMVRDVKKPSGALPGKVIYTNYHTIVVKA